MSEEALRRELRDELMPVLLRRIGRLTERLVTTGAAADGETEEARRIGWLLGFLSTLGGEDLLGARREPDELAMALELVGEWVAARGVSWTLLEPPRVATAEESRRASARCSALVVGAVRAESLVDRVRVEFVPGEDDVRVCVRLEAADARTRELEERLPRAWFEATS